MAVGVEANGSTLHDVLGKALLLEAGSPVALNWAIQSVRRGAPKAARQRCRAKLA